MVNIIVVGSSGHAKVIIDIIEQEGRNRIAGLLDRFREIGEQTLGYRILGKEEDLPQLIENHSLGGVIVAIGDNFIRSQVVERVRELCPDLPFVSAIHPGASISRDVIIGEGTAIMAGVTINASCSIGRFCILNTNSSLDHDSVTKDLSSIGPRATTGGRCEIGAYSAVSIGAVLVDGIHIGEHTIIGAGSTVLKDIDSFKVAYGTPAVAVRDRESGEAYL